MLEIKRNVSYSLVLQSVPRLLIELLHLQVAFDVALLEDLVLEGELDGLVQQLLEVDVAFLVAPQVEVRRVLGCVPHVVSGLAPERFAEIHQELGQVPEWHLLPLVVGGVGAPDIAKPVDLLDVGLDDVVLRVVEA